MVIFQAIIGVGISVLSIPVLCEYAFSSNGNGGAMGGVLLLVGVGMLCAAAYTCWLMMRSALELEAELKSK